MNTVASDEYMSVPKCALELKIGEWRIRYWLEHDPNFPRGLRAGRIVVKPSAVEAYFRRMDEVQEIVSGSLDEATDAKDGQGEYDEGNGEE